MFEQQFVEWIWELAVAVALVLLLRRFVCMFAWVKGSSMRDTLSNGALIFALRRELCGDPARFDVVLCRYPGRRGLFVKRVVALPGERISMVAGTLHIDGAPVEERFPLRPCRQSLPERLLGPGEFFLLGDNRPCSHDSRSVGPIRREAILAVVKCALLPPPPRRLR